MSNRHKKAQIAASVERRRWKQAWGMDTRKIVRRVKADLRLMAYYKWTTPGLQEALIDHHFKETK